MSRAALAVAVAWAGLVLAGWWISRETGTRVPLCMARRVTGVPCPGCGGTRSAMSLAGGDPAAAFAFNPLVAAFLVAGPVWLGWRWLRRGRPDRPWTPTTRKVLGLGALAAVAANWAYVLWHEPW